jgi:hypothetical protein
MHPAAACRRLFPVSTSDCSHRSITKKKDLGEGDRTLISLVATYMTAYANFVTDEVLYGMLISKLKEKL